MTIDPMEQEARGGDLSSEEMRRRRLQALEGRNSLSSPTFGRSPAVAPSVSSLFVDEDEDMQAAIALSLHNNSERPSQETSTVEKTENTATAAAVDTDKNMSLASSEEPFDMSSFHSIMWDDATTTENDKTRWIQQGIDFRDEMDIDAAPPASDSMLCVVGSNHGPWGLTQHHGGPCGVLAAVQAELLRLLLFGGRNPLEYPTEIVKDQTWVPTNHTGVSHTLVREALAMSIAIIIARATLMPPAVDEDADIGLADKKFAKIVLPSPPPDGTSTYTGLSWQHLYPSPNAANTTNFKVYTISAPSTPSKRQKMDEPQASSDWLVPREMRIIQLAHAITNFLLKPNASLDYYRKPGGVLLLCMSLVSSRGKDTIQSDMDDSMGMFTSQFGHCSQELMNLLLTGQAVSNVFDNTLTPSGGLECRGIQSRPAIGYLSQLEAMRYCEVGGYYKSPRFPIWVVGSTSHFSVLFGEPTCLNESKSDVLLEKCRRAFKSIQGAEENGYIPTVSLKQVLDTLGLHVGDDALYPVLCAMVEIGGAGIVVWDEFWKIASRLLTGATLESVLQREESEGSNDVSDSMPPLLLPNGELDMDQDKKPAARVDEPDKKPPARVTFQDAWETGRAAERMDAAKPPSVESDEEMARRLAEEWGANDINSPPVAAAPPAAAAAARPSSPMEMDSAMSPDEILARKLQAEVWESDAQDSGAASVDAVTDSPPPPLEGELKGELIVLDDADKLQFPEDSKMPAVTRKLDFEKFGNSFRLFHYNGLRGGSLTPFRVTRLTAEEAVGSSVPLTNSGGKGPAGTTSGDLEDVLRTKWPSCSIDWLGNASPSID